MRARRPASDRAWAAPTSIACIPGTPAPSDASCNAVDDNCDGLVDEGYVAQSTGCGVGACARSGATSCVAGVEQDGCQPGLPVFPIDENCNGEDEDCDGSADEEFLPTTSSCGRGACVQIGNVTCVNGQIDDTCVPGEPPSPVDDSCNGGDDDCDGSVDEEFTPQPTTCGSGACAAAGTLTCSNGVPSDSCTPLGCRHRDLQRARRRLRRDGGQRLRARRSVQRRRRGLRGRGHDRLLA